MCMGYLDSDVNLQMKNGLFQLWLLTTLFLLAMSGVAEREARPFVVLNIIRGDWIVVHELK
jgi:hypothetical protein